MTSVITDFNLYHVTYLCNLNLAEKYFGYKPGHLVTNAGDTIVGAKDDYSACEVAFIFWNQDNRPNGQTAPSLSMGDVVQVETFKPKTTGSRYYACATAGFEPIDPPTEFIPDDPETTVAQLLTEAAERLNAGSE